MTNFVINWTITVKLNNANKRLTIKEKTIERSFKVCLLTVNENDVTTIMNNVIFFETESKSE